MIAQLDKAFIKAKPWKLWSRLLAYVLFEGRPLTTKGQWFNPVVFGFFRLCRLVRPIKLVDDPIFIVGMGRSGTTALGSVLSMHRDIAYLNEPKALWHSIDDNEDLIGSYSDTIGRYRLDPNTVDRSKRVGISSVYRTLLSLTGSKFIVDKYPELLFRIPYVLALFPNAKFIMLTRNGFDNCKSIAKWCEVHRETTGDSTHDWWGKDNRKWNAICDQLLPEHEDLNINASEIHRYSNELNKASIEWIVTAREMSRALEAYPENVLRVDYDDLCSNTEEALLGLIAFAGVSVDETLITYGKTTLERQTISAQNVGLDIHVEKAFFSTMKSLGYTN